MNPFLCYHCFVCFSLIHGISHRRYLYLYCQCIIVLFLNIIVNINTVSQIKVVSNKPLEIPLTINDASDLEERKESSSVQFTEPMLDDMDPQDNDHDVTWEVIFQFMAYLCLYLIGLSILLIYLISESLPGDNIFHIQSNVQYAVSKSIAFVLVIVNTFITPKFVRLSLLICHCKGVQSHNKYTMILRMLTSIIIPFVFSVIVLDACASQWTQLWKPCIDDPQQFDIADQVHISSYMFGSHRVIFPPISIDVLSSTQICKSLSLTEIDFNKCLRSFLFSWSHVLVVKMITMVFMPILILYKRKIMPYLKHKCKRHVAHKKNTNEIDREYAMITVKL
eukprot:306667_1